jgi:hypothetical protein
MSYTPGPWQIRVDIFPNATCLVIEDVATGRNLAEIQMPDEDYEGGNAILMTASPDLLAACELQEIADYLAGWQEPGYDAHLAIVLLEGRGDYDSGWLPAREAAANYADYAHRARRAAIAKAKGGTQ